MVRVVVVKESGLQLVDAATTALALPALPSCLCILGGLLTTLLTTTVETHCLLQSHHIALQFQLAVAVASPPSRLPLAVEQ